MIKRFKRLLFRRRVIRELVEVGWSEKDAKQMLKDYPDLMDWLV